MVRASGFGEIEKLGAPRTVTKTYVSRDIEPLVPFTVTEYSPGTVLAVVPTLREEMAHDTELIATDVGLGVAESVAKGAEKINDETFTVRSTVPVKPKMPVTLMIEDCGLPVETASSKGLGIR